MQMQVESKEVQSKSKQSGSGTIKRSGSTPGTKPPLHWLLTTVLRVSEDWVTENLTARHGALPGGVRKKGGHRAVRYLS